MSALRSAPAVLAVAVALLAAGCASGRPAGPTVAPPAGTPTTGVPTTGVPTSGVPTTGLPTTGPPTTGPPTTDAPATSAPPAGPAPAGPRPGPGGSALVVSRGEASTRTVALTFDAGADRGFAGDILDTLAAEGIRASFGITGAWAEQNGDLVIRMSRDGHLIINHTWDHRSFTGVSARPAVTGRASRIDQLERTDAAIEALTGRSTRPWFRPPFGDYDASVNADVAAAGYGYNVLWTVDSLGWQGLSAAAIAARCVERTVPGAILLFHVGGQSQDATALPSIITRLRADGYGFATVAQIVGV